MLESYISYFVAYLLDNLKKIEIEKIERIVAYGSAVRDEITKESDVDIFIEVKKKGKLFEKEIRKIEERFYESREAILFKSKGIDNEFSVKIGILKEWKDLYKSISSTGILLYGPYEAKELPSGVNHFIIIFWDQIGKNRGAFLNKLYGFKIKGKRYEGLLARFNGKKLGKSCIILPIHHKKEIFKLIRDYEVSAKTIEVFS